VFLSIILKTLNKENTLLKLLRPRKLESLLEQRRERLHRLATSWCHDAMLADDLVQDTLGKALKYHLQLKDHKKLDAWLFRILHNTWMDHLRRYKPTTDLDDIDPFDEKTPESNLSDEQLAHRVQQAVFKLPIPQRQVVTLVDLEGSSYAEVSEILELPIGTVMSRLNRARNTLKKSLIGIQRRDSNPAHVDYIRRVK
jgi:RNA polymerase sigma-70 factor (ECF subfamily)